MHTLWPLAVSHYQANRLAAAEEACRRLLAAAPGHGDARHLLGVVLAKQRRYPEALEILREVGTLYRENWTYRNSLGVVLHRAGHGEESLAVLREVVSHAPVYVDAWNNLGNLYADLGRWGDAAEACQKVLALAPGHRGGLLGLAKAWEMGGNIQEAGELYGQLLASNPGDAAALSGRVRASLAQELNGDALAHLEAFLRRESGYAPAWSDFGAVLLRVGRHRDAELALRQALGQDPALVDAHHNLGCALASLGRHEEAVDAFRQALVLRPDDADIRLGLGNSLGELGRLEEADAEYRATLAIDAHRPEAYDGLGFLAESRGDLPSALEWYRKALATAPDDVVAANNIGGALEKMGCPGEAETHFRQLIASQPAEPAYRYSLSTLLLGQGRFEEGWKDFPSRFVAHAPVSARLPHVLARPFGQPEWDGRSPGRVLFWGEQGLADELWYGSLLPEAVARCGEAWVECDSRLVGLLSRALPNARVFPRQAAPAAPDGGLDWQCPFGRLGALLRPNSAAFRNRGGAWLQAEEEKKLYWQTRLAALGSGLKVGLSWRSTRAKPDSGHVRYPPLAAWLPLLSEDVTFVSLQYDQPEADLAYFRNQVGVEVHCLPGLDVKDDQESVAAVVSGLDLAIGVANAPIVLVAALGVEAWTLWSWDLRIAWRLHGGDRSPWFPHMRVFRRDWGMGWDEVFLSLKGALAQKRLSRR